MAINFDALPDSRPANAKFGPTPPGWYRAKIVDTKMRTSKAGNEYLEVTLELTDKDGKRSGRLWDRMFESDKPFLQFKLKRFVTALGIPLTGAFELKALPKLILNKEFVVLVTVDEKNDPPRNDVDVNHDEIYKPIAEWGAISNIGTATPAPTGSADDDDDLPFDLPDAPQDDDY